MIIQEEIQDEFCCPYCLAITSDEDSKLMSKVLRDRKGYIIIKCGCGEDYGMHYSRDSDYSTFKLLQ